MKPVRNRVARGAGERLARPRGGSSRPVRPARTTVTQRVVDAVSEMLRSGRYRVGERLPSEWELVERLSVGRSAVREAMRELATLDLVEIRPGRGTFVRSLRPDLLVRPDRLRSEVDRAVQLEFLEARMIIEPEAAALAATRATASDLERLAHDIACLREAVLAGFRPPEDLGFHLDVVRATRNSALVRLAGAIVSFYERDQAIPTERDVVEHGEVLAAIQGGDGDAARAAMRHHLAVEQELRQGGRG